MTEEHRLPPSTRLRLERRYRFSASHLYERPEWSEDENRAAFGKCAIRPGHGHNYRLWVVVEGEPSPLTGFAVDLVDLDRIVGREVLEPLDHRHLNHAIPAFHPGAAIPSSENLVLWIAGRLAEAIPPELSRARLVEARLFEDDDLGATWRA